MAIDGMRMGDGCGISMGCGHPEVEFPVDDELALVNCPSCGKPMHGRLKKDPNDLRTTEGEAR